MITMYLDITNKRLICWTNHKSPRQFKERNDRIILRTKYVIRRHAWSQIIFRPLLLHTTSEVCPSGEDGPLPSFQLGM